MWMATSMAISTFPLVTLSIGAFDPPRDATLTIAFFNLLSTIPVAYFSVFRARTGLRQMVFSRFPLAVRIFILFYLLRRVKCPM